MSANASFASTPAPSMAVLATGNTNTDGTTGAYVDVFTAPAAGSRVDAIEICASGASTTAGVIRLFLYDGTNTRLWKEVLVQAISPTTAIARWSSLLLLQTPLILKSGWKIKASTHNSEAFNVFVVTAGDFT